jgi:hypothetical protein
LVLDGLGIRLADFCLGGGDILCGSMVVTADADPADLAAVVVVRVLFKSNVVSKTVVSKTGDSIGVGNCN